MIDDGNGRVRAAAELAGARAGAYEVLAALHLNPPTPQLVAELLRLSTSSVMADFSDGPAAEHLCRYAAAYNGELDALRQEFDDLFVVPLGRYVTPYEAVYRDQRAIGEHVVSGLLMGPSTVAVLSEYRASGVEVSAMCNELPDHIGIELSFMAHLCSREREARGTGDEAAVAALRSRQQRFVEDHLLAWLPALSDRVVRNAQSDFYRGVALLTTNFVRADAAFVRADSPPVVLLSRHC
jgi:TorA maturation chaperone TorD